LFHFFPSRNQQNEFLGKLVHRKIFPSPIFFSRLLGIFVYLSAIMAAMVVQKVGTEAFKMDIQ
jgi:hypothetical protein